jgi:hypothetical protein
MDTIGLDLHKRESQLSIIGSGGEITDAAFTEALEIAKDREERMPSSAAAFRARAANILSVRDKILATLPEHHRRNYPPY